MGTATRPTFSKFQCLEIQVFSSIPLTELSIDLLQSIEIVKRSVGEGRVEKITEV